MCSPRSAHAQRPPGRAPRKAAQLSTGRARVLCAEGEGAARSQGRMGTRPLYLLLSSPRSRPAGRGEREPGRPGSASALGARPGCRSVARGGRTHSGVTGTGLSRRQAASPCPRAGSGPRARPVCRAHLAAHLLCSVPHLLRSGLGQRSEMLYSGGRPRAPAIAGVFHCTRGPRRAPADHQAGTATAGNAAEQRPGRRDHRLSLSVQTRTFCQLPASLRTHAAWTETAKRRGWRTSARLSSRLTSPGTAPPREARLLLSAACAQAHACLTDRVPAKA